MQDYALARRTMVDCQLRPFDVTDRAVLAAVDELPRELFVPPGSEAFSYSDVALPLAPASGPGTGRVMLSPMTLARIVQALEIEPGDRVLDVGGGFGYGAALLARLGASVVALETSEIAGDAEARGALAQRDGVVLRSGPLADGSSDDGPFGAILVHGSVEERPLRLLEQLAPNGRLACLVAKGRAGQATLFVRSGQGFGSRSLFEAAAPVLPGFEKARDFVF